MRMAISHLVAFDDDLLTLPTRSDLSRIHLLSQVPSLRDCI